MQDSNAYLLESRRIREEQDRAYAESLAADQAKDELKVQNYTPRK